VSDAPARPADLADLVRYSARIGADPLLIQAAGGNTSVKADGTMWIKASGTLLAEAERRDVFVPVDLEAMRAALATGEARADRPVEFALGDGRLRPSIETSLHAVFPHRIVVHVHCVNTIALAIRADAETALAARLAGFDWAFVPYAKPGATLARQVADARGPATDVVVLGNHGLIVAAAGVAQAEALLDRVVAALAVAPTPAGAPDLSGLEALCAGSAYAVPPGEAPMHQLGLEARRTAVATGGSLYPDHVIFCGPGALAVDAVDALPGTDGPPFVIVPGKGALIRRDADAGARALADCLGDVLTRLQPGAVPTYLTAAQDAELMDWDAEKYRKALNAG